jgi:hypothetical protein
MDHNQFFNLFSILLFIIILPFFSIYSFTSVIGTVARETKVNSRIKFDIPMIMNIKITTFRDVTLCSLMDRYLHFKGTGAFIISVEEIVPIFWRNLQPPFYLEDGGSRSQRSFGGVRKVGGLPVGAVTVKAKNGPLLVPSTYITAYQPNWAYSSLPVL